VARLPENYAENYAERESGLIVPLSTIPGDDHRGTFGPEYIEFLNAMQSAGFGVLHDLPLNPPDDYNCPYSSVSTFAIDPQRIDLEMVAATGDISNDDLNAYQELVASGDAGPAIKSEKERLLGRAFVHFDNNGSPERKASFAKWRAQQADWIDSYASFEVAKYLPQNYGKRWKDWETAKDFSPMLVTGLKAGHRQDFSQIAYTQWVAEKQTVHYQKIARSLGIKIWGDVPFYVGDGDVWAKREIFNLDSDGNQLDQGGAAPSLTSSTGQLWGNATYQTKTATLDWWERRLLRAHTLTPDSVRLDHFIGFAEPYIIAIDAADGTKGWRVEGIGKRLLDRLVEKFGPDLPFYPEDLGTQTEATAKLRDKYGLLASKLAVRALNKELLSNQYDGAPNNPDNYGEWAVAFTGNHDTPTLVQAISGIQDRRPDALNQYVRHLAQQFPERHLDQYSSDGEQLVGQLAQVEIERVIRSAAQYAFLPLGDLFLYGEEAQFNIPNTIDPKNWSWRMTGVELQKFKNEAEGWRNLNTSSGRSLQLNNETYSGLITSILGSGTLAPLAVSNI